MGDPRNDYFTGGPDQTVQGGAPSTEAGFGPNTRTLMQIRVSGLTGTADPHGLQRDACRADGCSAAAVSRLAPAVRGSRPRPEWPLVRHEIKTLNEDFDEYGRLLQRVGTDLALYRDSYGRNYMEIPTEVYDQGQTVVWDIYNTTGDTHPMHFHLVNVQVLGRATFDDSIPNILTFQPSSSFTPPDPNYRGWKETVRMQSGRSYAGDHEIRHASRSSLRCRRARGPVSRRRMRLPRIRVALPHPRA